MFPPGLLFPRLHWGEDWGAAKWRLDYNVVVVKREF
jgi:hypothetical protein